MGKTTYQFLQGKEHLKLGVDDWSDMGLRKPVLFISGLGWSRKLASFNSQNEADIFITYLKDGLLAAVSKANPNKHRE